MRLRDLGTWRLPWRDLLVIVKHLPRSSALIRELLGENHDWDLTNHLLAAEVDAARLANWMQTEDGAKGRNRPTPVPRPGVEPDKSYGSEAIPMDEMADWLGWERQLADPDN